jgi:glucokinase
MDEERTVLGVDLGGTNVRAGILTGDRLGGIKSSRIDARAPAEEVFGQVCAAIDACKPAPFAAIGMGVPSLVDAERGIAYDTLNIPGWTEFPLRKRLEDRYRVPAFVNNDANCFILGEKRFGKGRPYRTLVGLTLGTGLGGGLIIDGRLHAGRLGGAGEFGMVPYRDRFVEYYAAGQFFKNVHGVTGEEAASRAAAGDAAALAMFREYGTHLGNAIQVVLHVIDPEIIILGGSVSREFRFFEAGMRESLRTFAYPRVVETLKIEVSELPNAGLMGAAALCLERPL